MILKETYEDRTIHENWESVYRRNPVQDDLNARMLERILSSLRLPERALCLDAGCGTGKHTLSLMKRGYRCVGVDLSERALQKTKARLAEDGLNAEGLLVCHALEAMPFQDETFDMVYCRGVLMHIPDWILALGNLCRVLKRGGKIVILESNHRALEAALVRLVRGVVARRSRIVETEGGLEFWSGADGGRPYVVRIADIDFLIRQLQAFGIRCTERFATEFWDLNRFPSGLMRDLAARYNRLWFSLKGPPFLSIGNAVIGSKQ